MRILVADDHELLRRGVRFVVQERPDWEICAEAVDGCDAVEKARKSRPDVAVLDVSMPRLNGLEATLAIQESSPETRVVILTQHESVEMVRHAFEAGARAYVVKSKVASDLVNAIEAVSQGQFFFSDQWQAPSHSVLCGDDPVLERLEIEERSEQRTVTLQKLSASLLHRQDQERRSIGQELREVIGRDLGGIAFNLELIARANGHGSDPLFADTVQLVRRCLAKTRCLSQSLDPPLLDEIGLASAGQWLVENFGVRTGIEVRSEWVAADRLPREVEWAFFWILDEALANIRAHSGTKFAEVSIKVDSYAATLEIRDHGCGIPADALDGLRRGEIGPGVGLAGMRERLREFGGQLDVWSGENGTSLRARIPAAVIQRLAPREEPPESAQASAACA